MVRAGLAPCATPRRVRGLWALANPSTRTFATGHGVLGFVDGAEIVLLVHDDKRGGYAIQRISSPAGAHDLAIVPSGTSEPSGLLVVTGASGTPAVVSFPLPSGARS